MMFRMEWRKAWSQRSTLMMLLLACAAQVVFVFAVMNRDAKETAVYYNAYAGPMDIAWRQEVLEAYERLWPVAADPDSEAYYESTLEQRTMLGIVPYTDFTRMIDEHVADLKVSLSADPDYDLSRVDSAYAALREASEDGTLEFGFSPAAEGMAIQTMVNWAFVLFMLYFAVSQTSADSTTGMESLLAVTRKGRSLLFRTRFRVHQCSALAVWLLTEGTLAITLTFYGGWGHVNSIVQDFIFNTSPYPWNAGQVMAVVLLCSLASGQVLAAGAFCLVRVGKNALTGFVIGAGALVLPLILSLNSTAVWVALLPPCLMQSSWMWGSYREFRIGGLYLKPWHIAAAELIVIAAAVLLWKRKQEEHDVSI